MTEVEGHTGWGRLTAPERRVVELLIEGLTNGQIAERLSLSKYTVQTHLKRIFRKLNVSTRTELAVKATLWPKD